MHPSSFHRRTRRLRPFLEPLRQAVLKELAGDPETLVVDSTLLAVLHPRQVGQSAWGFEGAHWARWGSFCVYGVKLHLLCSTNRVPISFEMSAANTAEILLVEELLADAALLEEEEGELTTRGGYFGGPRLPERRSERATGAGSGILLARQGRRGRAVVRL